MAAGRVGAERLNALCERSGFDDIEALSDAIIDRSEEAPFIFQHGTDAGIVGETGTDDGAIDQPRAFEFVDVLIGLAADEDLVEGDLQGREAFAQDLEHLLELEIAGRLLVHHEAVELEAGVLALEVEAVAEFAVGGVHGVGEFVLVDFRDDVEGGHGGIGGSGDAGILAQPARRGQSSRR